MNQFNGIICNELKTIPPKRDWQLHTKLLRNDVWLSKECIYSQMSLQKLWEVGKNEDWLQKIKIRYDTGDLQLISAKLESVYELLEHGVLQNRWAIIYGVALHFSDNQSLSNLQKRSSRTLIILKQRYMLFLKTGGAVLLLSIF